VRKPVDVFDRDREWGALDEFVTAGHPGATLGVVYGRRRQGKTYLLESLAAAHHGFYFASLRQSSAQNLQRLADQYQAFTNTRVKVTFGSWEEAVEALLALGENAAEPVLVVLDEFPYLLDTAPELPSVLQALLSPKGQAVQGWKTRLILCGSALSTMQGLLGGTAPLRGRAALELVVRPFGYRAAATFWEVTNSDLALRLNALVGGTPAYRDMCGGGRPTSPGRFDTWVIRHLLDPSSAMFREGNALLSEQDRVVDTAGYFAILAAISRGRTRRGEIAAAVGRAEGALAHPLTVLTEAGLIDPLGDALRQKRTTFHLAEPVLRLHQLVIAPNESRLSRHQAERVWSEVADTVSSRIYGPHFEGVARTWCAEHASTVTLGGVPSRVAATVVACREHGRNHEVDVVVTEVRAQVPNTVVALGEAKWRTSAVGVAELSRLEHLRDLLGVGPNAKLLLFSRAGFTQALRTAAAARDDVELIDPPRLYTGS
jgi:AAA+ ATPase superfamily predicted ATPase